MSLLTRMSYPIATSSRISPRWCAPTPYLTSSLQRKCSDLRYDCLQVPSFMAGKIMLSDLPDKLTSQAFFNPYILPLLTAFFTPTLYNNRSAHILRRISLGDVQSAHPVAISMPSEYLQLCEVLSREIASSISATSPSRPHCQNLAHPPSPPHSQSVSHPTYHHAFRASTTLSPHLARRSCTNPSRRVRESCTAWNGAACGTGCCQSLMPSRWPSTSSLPLLPRTRGTNLGAPVWPSSTEIPGVKPSSVVSPMAVRAVLTW